MRCPAWPSIKRVLWLWQGDAKQIVALKKKPIVAVGSGAFHSCAVTGDGQLFSWGLGGFGRLGHGDRLKKVSPKIVASLCGREVTLPDAPSPPSHGSARELSVGFASWLPYS